MQGVDQLALGKARMRGDAGDPHRGLIGREAFEFQLARPAAVQRIGEVGAEIAGQIRADAAADLFVGGEGDADRPMRDLRVGQQMPRRGHRDRHPGLVVAAQQRGAAGGDDVVALLFAQPGRIGRRQRQSRRVGKGDLAAVVAAMHHRLDPGGIVGRRGIDMGEQAQRGRRAGDGGRHRGQHHAVVGQRDVGGADRLQLLDQHALQVKLDRGARRGGRGLVALGVHRAVADEALFQFGVEFGAHCDLLKLGKSAVPQRRKSRPRPARAARRCRAGCRSPPLVAGSLASQRPVLALLRRVYGNGRTTVRGTTSTKRPTTGAVGRCPAAFGLVPGKVPRPAGAISAGRRASCPGPSALHSSGNTLGGSGGQTAPRRYCPSRRLRVASSFSRSAFRRMKPWASFWS